MNRLVVILALALPLFVAQPAPGQELKERSLSDTPAPSHQQTAPAAQTAAPYGTMSQPGAATVSPAPAPAAAPGQDEPSLPPPPTAGRPAPQPYNQHTGQSVGVPPMPSPYPAPPTQPAPPPPAGASSYGQPGSVPPPSPGATPINGRTDLTPPPPPPAGGTPINGRTNVTPPPPPPPPPPSRGQTYKREEVNREVMGFFESGSRGLAEMVARAFRDLGEPTGFIKGNEAGGALIVGLRYGVGTLYLKGQKPMQVYWQSPSLGLDLGVNAVKVFTLVYGTTNPNEIFQRFPGVDGSAYIIGGFGMNYQRSEGITLAPIRFGVGLRLGANVGYQHYTRTQEVNPF